MIKQRDYRIDALYTIGIFLVLIGHSHPSDWSLFADTFYVDVIVFIYTFHMALFFFIAGYLLENSNNIERFGYKKWIRNKALRMLTPYIVLSVVALFPKYYIEHHSMPDLQAILTTIFQPRAGVWGHFWFIPVLFMCYVLFGLWKSFVTTENEKIMTGVLLIFSLLLYFLPYATDWMAFADLKEACIFISIGITTRKILKNSGGVSGKSDVLFRLVCITGAVILNSWLMKVDFVQIFSRLLSADIMIFASWQLAALIGKNSFTFWVSRHNFTIYIYSWLFQSVVMTICGAYGMLWYMTSLLMFLSGFAGPVLMITIYEKFTKVHNRVFDLMLGVK